MKIKNAWGSGRGPIQGIGPRYTKPGNQGKKPSTPSILKECIMVYSVFSGLSISSALICLKVVVAESQRFKSEKKRGEKTLVHFILVHSEPNALELTKIYINQKVMNTSSFIISQI